MKTLLPGYNRLRGQRAMTLPELMINVCLFSIAVLALVTVNLFGLFQDELVNSSLGASDEARVNFNQMLDEIRAGKNVQIGYGNYSNFVAIGSGAQQGDTIQIIPSTNTIATSVTNVYPFYIYYYFLTNTYTNSGWLMRATVTNWLSTNGGTVSTNFLLLTTNIMATCITNMNVTNLGLTFTNVVISNSMLFTAVAYNGGVSNFTVLTNDPTTYSTYNYLVDVILQFYQYQYPLTKVGTGSNYLFNYYQIELAAARRAASAE
jgi:hypothetical protein